MRAAVIAWGRTRWGDARVIQELVLGCRRVDLVFVAPADVVAIEIKSSVDTLDRLEGQLQEYGRYVPEVWIAVAARWRKAIEDKYGIAANKIVVVDGRVETIGTYRRRPGEAGLTPHRDELAIMRLIDLLWKSEAARIAERTGVFPGARHTQVKTRVLRAALARMLTGNEILREVCAELRRRPLVGRGSDAPRTEVAA